MTWLELERAGATLSVEAGQVRAQVPASLREAMREAMAWRLTVLRPQAARGMQGPEARPASERPCGPAHVWRVWDKGQRIEKRTPGRPKYGHCLSCGDALREHWMQYDCALCVAAWTVARREAGRVAA